MGFGYASDSPTLGHLQRSEVMKFFIYFVFGYIGKLLKHQLLDHGDIV